MLYILNTLFLSFIGFFRDEFIKFLSHSVLTNVAVIPNYYDSAKIGLVILAIAGLPLTAYMLYSKFRNLREPVFLAEIRAKKEAYDRGDKIVFRSKYKGNVVKNAFFANYITAPNGTLFNYTTPNVEKDFQSVRTWPKKTLDEWSDKGKLNGYVNTDWVEWSWDIPTNAPIGQYKVLMAIWNTFKNDNKLPFITTGTKIFVTDPSGFLVENDDGNITRH
jgi:hypothetical protein